MAKTGLVLYVHIFNMDHRLYLFLQCKKESIRFVYTIIIHINILYIYFTVANHGSTLIYFIFGFALKYYFTNNLLVL